MEEGSSSSEDEVGGEEGSSSCEEDGQPLFQTTLCQTFWTHIEAVPARAAAMKQWILLAQLIFVMVPGSVEEERMFSAMKYIKNPQRNSLQQKHLTQCARAFHHPRVTLRNFPYKEAIRAWLEQKERRKVQ